MGRSSAASLTSLDLLFPLSEFTCRPGGHVFELDEPELTMPEPYRTLLVHERDMTSTLEAFYCEQIRLEQIATRSTERVLYRQVVLVGEDTGRAFELGAIRIDLEALEPEARAVVNDGRMPLGAVLAEFGVTYLSRPRVFFSLTSDAWIDRILGLAETATLYGRQNVLRTDEGRVIADVVEILPPA